MHGLQFWVALPKDQEDVEPSFHFSESVVNVPTDESDDEEVNVNLVVGSALGLTQTDIPILPGTGDLFLIDVDFVGDTASWSCPPFLLDGANGGVEIGVYVSSGRIRCDSDDNKNMEASVGEMLVLKSNSIMAAASSLTLQALEAGTRVAILGGTPLPERRHLLWNFCSHDKDKLTKAVERWDALDRSIFPPVVNESNDDSIPIPRRNGK
jgi:redox-sensitive bicupin YhaK (pirin superfamily)